MLRKIRISLAALFLVGITLLFVGIGHEWWGWMAKIQFLPSMLALNVVTVAAILLLTFLFGRIYCSVICPLGVLQDAVNWLRGKIAPRKRQFHKERRIVRYAIMVITVAAHIAGLQVLVALVAPYSAYGRIVRSIAGLASGEFAWPLLAVGLGTLLVIAICAWFWGRDYCNTVCPVGSILSLASRFAIFRPRIDTGKCVSCGRCEKSCKAACIDSKNKTIDYSRCVGCFDCLDACKLHGLRYTHSNPADPHVADAPRDDASSTSRRSFLATVGAVGMTAVAAKAQEMKVDGGLAKVVDKVNPDRSTSLVPPGAGSVKHFYDHCTACQLCVAACPNGVLRPSTDLEHLLQPQMGYDKGWCRPECTACSDACPAGAILPLSREQKAVTHIGVASVNLDLCLPANGGPGCGNCSRHCPTGAIRMVKGPNGRNIPTVAEEVCIGCGACENLCPSRPISAITVNGLEVHRNG